MNHPYRGYQPRIKWNRKQWSFLWIATDCIRKKKLNVSQKVSLLRVGEIDKGKTNDDVRNNKKDRKTRSVDWCVFQWVRWFAFSYLFLFFVYFQFSLSLSPSLPPSPPPSLSLSLKHTHTTTCSLSFFTTRSGKRVSFNRESFVDKTMPVFSSENPVYTFMSNATVCSGRYTLYLHGRPGWINFCFWFQCLCTMANN